MSILRTVAIHEAGHAVFLWRGGELVYGDKFNDLLVPFREIVLNDQPLDAEGYMPPMQLEDGSPHDAAGSVVLGYRLTVPAVRGIGGITLAQRRTMVGHAKREAESVLVGTLAGPLVEEHFLAMEAGRSRCFFWSDELENEQDGWDDGRDVTQAFTIAKEELCRGHRAAIAFMDAAVKRIEQHLDGDGRYWRTITALAAELEARIRVDREEAVDVMRAAWSA